MLLYIRKGILLPALEMAIFFPLLLTGVWILLEGVLKMGSAARDLVVVLTGVEEEIGVLLLPNLLFLRRL